MKNLYMPLVFLFMCLLFQKAAAQNIYIKATLQGGAILSQNANPNTQPSIRDADAGQPVNLKDYMEISELSYDTEQTVNFGTSPGGSGAGKIVFNPIVIKKRVDAASTRLFLAQAQGTPLDLEILFAGRDPEGETRVIHKLIVRQVLVKNYGNESSPDCSTCPLLETISLEYGTLIIYTYSQNVKGVIVANAPVGWNRITNTAVNK